MVCAQALLDCLEDFFKVNWIQCFAADATPEQPLSCEREVPYHPLEDVRFGGADLGDVIERLDRVKDDARLGASIVGEISHGAIVEASNDQL